MGYGCNPTLIGEEPVWVTHPCRRRLKTGSAVHVVEPRIRALLAQYPRMPGTVIAERVGRDRGLTVFKERVAVLRPVYLPPDPASRTTYLPGEIAQFEFWFPRRPRDPPGDSGRFKMNFGISTSVLGRPCQHSGCDLLDTPDGRGPGADLAVGIRSSCFKHPMR